MVRYILSVIDEIRINDKGGNTALHMAATNTNLGVCEILLSHKAAVNAINNEHDTPLILAVAQGARDAQEKTIEVLLRNGASVSLYNKSEQHNALFVHLSNPTWTVLHYALSHNFK